MTSNREQRRRDREHERRWLTTEARSRIDFRRQLITLLYILVIGALAAAFYLITKL